MEELQEAWSPFAVPEPLLDPTLVTECLCFFFYVQDFNLLSSFTTYVSSSCELFASHWGPKFIFSHIICLSHSFSCSPVVSREVTHSTTQKATKLTNQKYLFFQEMIKVPALMVMGLGLPTPNITNPLPAFSSTEPSFAVPIEWVESSTFLPSSSVRSPPVQQVLQVVMDINRLATID